MDKKPSNIIFTTLQAQVDVRVVCLECGSLLKIFNTGSQNVYQVAPCLEGCKASVDKDKS